MNSHTPSKKVVQKAVTAFVSGLLILTSSLSYAAPKVSLFSSDVRSNLIEAQANAANLEKTVGPKVETLTAQYEAFKGSQCEEDTSDAGCAQMKAQIVETYKGLLEDINAQLPAMVKTVDRTKEALGGRINKQLAPKDPRELQQLLSGQTNSIASKHRGRGNLSKQINQYLKVLRSGTGGKEDLTVTAANLYLDMSASSDQLRDLQGVIEASLTDIQVRQSLGQALNESDMSNLTAINSIVFGAADEGDDIIEMPDSIDEDGKVEPAGIDVWGS